MKTVEAEILIDGTGETRYVEYDVPDNLETTDEITEYIEDEYDVCVSKLYGIG